MQDKMKFIDLIKISEKQITKGKFVKANTNMADEEIDDLLLR